MNRFGMRSIAGVVIPLALACSLAAPTTARAQDSLPHYRDSRAPIDARVQDLLARMTPEEKFWQLFMVPGDVSDSGTDWHDGVFGLQVRPATATGANPARTQAARINANQRYFVEHSRLGIPMIPFEEGVHGLLADGATVFPQAIGLAATWDTALVRQVAGAIADEARSRGIRQLLSPVINLATDVRWGRVEETYGEDPVLTSAMATAYVSALEQRGVIATPKHFVANVGEGGRDSYPIDLDMRALEEYHFPPFRAALAAGAQSVMAAYNSVNGIPMSQNPMLRDVLERAWGFGGFVISDAAATGGATVLQLTEPTTASATKHAIEAGLDVIFQTEWKQHRPYLAAFTSGAIDPHAIDSAVARVLRAKFGLGLFEHPYASEDSAAAESGSEAHRALARQAARESVVLLKNSGGVLPLARGVKSIAVIGGDAAEARLGGYSGPGNHVVSILDGLRSAAGSAAHIAYEPGPGRTFRDHVVVPAANLWWRDSLGRASRGLRGDYFAGIGLAGAPQAVRTDTLIDFGWTLGAPARGLPLDWYSIRWSGDVVAPPSGVARLGVEGTDGWRLYVDGALVLDAWTRRSAGAQLATVNFRPRSSHAVRLEYHETRGNAHVKLMWDTADARALAEAQIERAVQLARRSAVAVVVAGIEEGEFRDRSHLGLPGLQEELIDRVAATGTPTVVVLIGGSAITGGDWLARVGAVIDAWYPGDEGGDAVADVLLGRYDPAGRLPMTWPIAEGQLPLVYDHQPTGRGDDYVDLTGEPLFPFGYGLSYTTFAYSDLHVGAWNGDSATVSFRVTNTGTREGDEVAQLYVHDLVASVARPVIQLEGFRRVSLAPGESRELTFTLGREQLQMLDAAGRWVVEPGTFRILVGSSSRDLRLRGELDVR